MPELTSSPQSGADIIVQCLINHGVEVIFAIRRGQHADSPGPDALQLAAAHCPAAAQAGLRLHGRRLCPQYRPRRRLHGHQRPRCYQPRDLSGRCQIGLGAHRGHHRPGQHARHRLRRFPGNSHCGSLPGGHQAPLPGDAHRPRSHASSRKRSTSPAPEGLVPYSSTCPRTCKTHALCPITIRRWTYQATNRTGEQRVRNWKRCSKP